MTTPDETGEERRCYTRSCDDPVRWQVVDLMDRIALDSCDSHASHAVHRRMRQIGRGAQVVIRPVFTMTSVEDCAVLMAVSGELAAIVGKDGVPRLVAESTTTEFAKFIQALGGRVHRAND